MNAHSEGRSAGAHADQLASQILKAAHGWAREAPEALRPYVRAVCIRLGEMIADQRNFFAPLPEPQEAERAEVLALVARQLASAAVAEGVEKQLQMWSEKGVEITSLSLRSWEATAEFFRVGTELPATATWDSIESLGREAVSMAAESAPVSG